MARITIEDALEKTGNRFALSMLAAQRAIHLCKGSKPLIEGTNNREIVTALREIAAGKVTFAHPELLHKSSEASRKSDEFLENKGDLE